MHFRHENSSADGIALAHTVYGEHVTATARPDATMPNVQPSIGNIMAPYKPPPRRKSDSPDIALCAEEGCKGFPVSDLDYCAGHARKRGLLLTCKMCGRIPKRGTGGYCYWHSEAGTDETAPDDEAADDGDAE